MAVVLQTIGLCKLVAITGKAVYDASIKVANNFKQPRSELSGKVNELKTQVIRLGKKLDERCAVLEQSDTIKDLYSLLTRIMVSLTKIEKFFGHLEKYESHNSWKFLPKAELTLKYFKIQHKFKGFYQILDSFVEDLDKIQKLISFEEQLDTRLVIHDVQQVQSKLSADHENFKNRLAEGFEDHKVFMVEFIRKLEFDKRHIAPDGNLPNPVMPYEITKKKDLSKVDDWDIYTAILDKENVTVKRLRDTADHNLQASFRKEALNLMRFSRGSLVRVIGMCDEENDKFLVLEYMEKGDLSTLLHKSGEKISLSNKVNLATTAASAFYCMNHKLVHLSLRTEKFLVDKYYTAKLSGMMYAKTFSSAKRHGSEIAVDLNCCRAPELYKPGKLSTEADVYGFGIVLWEIFTQMKPFSTLAEEIGREPTYAEVKKFVADDKREEYKVGSGDIETMVSNIIRDCRALDPKKRPGVPEILDRLEKVRNTLEDLED